MSLVSKLWWGLVYSLSFVFKGLFSLLWALLGKPSWQPPSWPGNLGRTALAHPGRALGLLATTVAIASAGWWWVHRPQPPEPERITFSVSAPGLTDYRQAPIAVQALRVSFSGSVAPIDLVGKPAIGVTMAPALAGTWTWDSDTELSFQPAADWPTGAHYEVEFDTQAAFASQALLDQSSFEFDSAAFTVSNSSNEFYQDPQQATLKKAIFQLEFSHPVDAATLESRVALKLANGGGTALPTPTYTFNYDEQRLTAWVHSAPLELPANGGRIDLALASGVRSTVEGTASESTVDATVSLPALYSLAVNDITPGLVDNERFEPEQVLVLEFSGAVRDSDVQQSVEALLLPKEHPEHPGQAWNWSASELTGPILRQARRIPLTPIPAEREYIETHSFKYQAEQGAQVYVSVRKGLTSFGGFRLGENRVQVLEVPRYPELLRFVATGSLLSLRGERKLTVVSRNLPGMQLEIGRILPSQLQHLVHFNEGTYSEPALYSSLDFDALSERFEQKLPLPGGEPGKSRYDGIDLGAYLAEGRRGIFLLTLKAFDPADPENWQEQRDQRLVVLTDLGLIAKQQKDGSRVVFVASLKDGSAIEGATVSVIGSNGEPAIQVRTNGSGRAELPDFRSLEREKKPVLIAAQLGDDVSFLPLENSWPHKLDLSRFDIGGDVNPATAGTLDAHLFSDRGLYRPGEEMHLAAIVRAADWQTSVAGLPARAQIVDPQGATVYDQPLALDATGFQEFAWTSRYGSPTGTYAVSAYLLDANDNRTELGSTTVRLREFLPDRLKVKATLSSASVGWVKPTDLSARVDVANLFGTPAQGRRVEATLDLQPAFPRFGAWPNHQFFDPRRAEEGFSEELTAQETDDSGVATFALPLSNYADATYQLAFQTQAYEAAGGRSVAAETVALVSANDYLVGIKATDSMDYITRGAVRSLNVVAVDPQLRPFAVPDLHVVLIEQRYVSLLTKQSSGAYKYESQLREQTLSDTPLVLDGSAAGSTLAVKTDQPGTFRIELRSGNGQILNQLNYSVAGNANLTRSLERNAELKLQLSKGEYATGEQLEIAIRAPYTGSGLITIERDRIYAHRWFHADTTSSVQYITVPAGLDGGAYVNVQFVRDPDSDEVFMSPLSFGVAAFTINRGARTASLELGVPKRVKPGEMLTIDVSSDTPVRAAVFAVDVGILQVARYRLEDPLDHFLRKRMLEVETAQILDLILPEFSKLASLSAPGGDDDSGLGQNLNPFKRKRDQPAVHWFGLVDIDGRKQLQWTVPDTFNGAVKVMAVAVGAEKIGIAQETTEVRGDFVLSPNVPTTIAPGDAFEVSLGVADNRDGPDIAAGPLAIQVEAPAGIVVDGPAQQSLALTPGKEGVVIWKLHAEAQLGTPELRFSVTAGRHSARQGAGLSLRPAIPRQTVLTSGRMDDRTLVIDGNRPMWNEYARREVAASPVPAVLIDGLNAYLGNFPHLCTEQLVSQGLPALVFAKNPDFGTVQAAGGDPHQGVLAVLRSRQNDAGAFGLWTASVQAEPFVSAYAVLYLLEARERGMVVPQDLLDRANGYLQALAADESSEALAQVRARAMAVYLLTRQGQVTTNWLLTVRQKLEANWPNDWQKDVSAVLLAASYAGMKQNETAKPLLGATMERLRTKAELADWQYAGYYDPLIADALGIYLLHKHFPAEARKLPPTMAERLVQPISRGYYNTLSSALSILALEAMFTNNPDIKPAKLSGLDQAGLAIALQSSGTLVQRALYDDRSVKLRIEAGGPPPLWYVRTETGFDRQLPSAPAGKGIEIRRDYLDANGKETTSATLGDELTVRLRLRATERGGYQNLAIIDLLPGGFEVVEPEPDADGVVPDLVTTTTAIEHVDAREDRMLIYANASDAIAEFSYRVKATAVGKFVQPPPYAESMYERDVRATGAGGSFLEVKRP